MGLFAWPSALLCSFALRGERPLSDVFISYARDDQATVRKRLDRELEAADVVLCRVPVALVSQVRRRGRRVLKMIQRRFGSAARGRLFRSCWTRW